MEKPDVLYGIHPVAQVLGEHPERIRKIWVDQNCKNPRIYEIVKSCRKQGIVCQYVPDLRLKSVAPYDDSQGVVAFKSALPYADMESVRAAFSGATQDISILAADNIEDPQNLGAMIRSAYAAGAACLILEGAGGAGLTPAVARASAGASEHLPVCRVRSLSSELELLRQEYGFKILGLICGHGLPSLFDQELTGRILFVLGSENRGIRPHLKRTCDSLVSIPLAVDFNSLNVSVAAGICLFEARRQRIRQSS